MFNSNQFIISKLIPTAIPNKFDKIPACPHTLELGINAHDTKHHTSYNHALQMAQLCGEGYCVAFVLTHNDPYFCIDIDDCFQNGQWSAISATLCQTFPGAYVEISASGKALHIFGTYQGVEPEHKCKNKELNMELYTAERFIVLTGNQATGNADTDHTAMLYQAIEWYWQQSDDVNEVGEWEDVADSRWAGPTDDAELIQLAMNSKSAQGVFGGKATFEDLFTGNAAVLAATYPSGSGDEYDRSSADAALAQHLAFWTGNNPVRIDRIMRQSALYRDKWDNHKSYTSRTVTQAISKQKDVYFSKRYKVEPVEYQPVNDVPTNVMYGEVTTTVGDQFLTPSQQIDYFKGCVYVRDLHRAWTPDGSFLKPEQFKATYGGYIFSMDGQNEKVTKSAWEVFTESQAVRFPKVARTVFRPELPSGGIFEEEGLKYVNTYVPIVTKQVPGDISPFLNHLRLILPDPNDQEIVLSYMAACVQYPGVKFQWCPLLQGAEGNGKTLFTRCIAYSVGDRYTHLPNAKELGEGGAKFTTWIQNKLFIGVEEIYVSDRREVTEALKVFITNDRIEIQGKGLDQVMGDNRANFLMCSNHKDALHVTVDSRRYAVFYTAQQNKADLEQSGMSGNYFPNLYHWLKNKDGYAMINHFLHTYQIKDEFNPATHCQKAPLTSSTNEAITVSMGSVEQEIIEAIESGRVGFRGGWISSKKLDEFLKEIRAERKVPINKRREMLQKLGYDWHPGLTDGRTNSPLPHEDNAKPKLFIQRGHISSNLQGADAVAKYCHEQGYVNFTRVSA